MIRALGLIFLAPLLVAGANVPFSHSLVRRNSRAQVPRTLMDRSPDLVARQGTCGIGQSACTTGGCCDGSCCGDGCCPIGYVCHFVGNTPGCCPTGQTCSDVISGCTDPTLVECTGYDFCCPAGQTCSQDASGNAQCGGVPVGGGGGNGNGGSTPVNTPTRTTPLNVPTSSPQFSVINTNTVAAGGNGNNNGGGATVVTTPNIAITTTPKPTSTAPVVPASNGNGAKGLGVGSGALGAVVALVAAVML